MALHVFGTILTHRAVAHNNRGENEGTVSTLQKIIRNGEPHRRTSLTYCAYKSYMDRLPRAAWGPRNSSSARHRKMALARSASAPHLPLRRHHSRLLDRTFQLIGIDGFSQMRHEPDSLAPLDVFIRRKATEGDSSDRLLLA